MSLGLKVTQVRQKCQQFDRAHVTVPYGPILYRLPHIARWSKLYRAKIQTNPVITRKFAVRGSAGTHPPPECTHFGLYFKSSHAEGQPDRVALATLRDRAQNRAYNNRGPVT